CEPANSLFVGWTCNGCSFRSKRDASAFWISDRRIVSNSFILSFNCRARMKICPERRSPGGENQFPSRPYQPRTYAKISGATIVASDSMMNFGVSMLSLPHVIFSLGTAPEYEP